PPASKQSFKSEAAFSCPPEGSFGPWQLLPQALPSTEITSQALTEHQRWMYNCVRVVPRITYVSLFSPVDRDKVTLCEPASFPSIPHFFCSFFPSFIPHVLPSTFLFVALPDSFSQ
ncbi:hypothetical protein NQZ68_003414, partial [Dissostichus eleginoides]